MVAGVHNLRILPTHAKDGYALQPGALEAAVQADAAAGLLPCYVVATIGTTGSCAVDPVPELAAVAQRHGLWCGACVGGGGGAGQPCSRAAGAQVASLWMRAWAPAELAC